MKAQSLRRLLTLTDVALVLGIAGAGAWYLAKVRPAAASDAKRMEWSAQAYKEYQNAALTAHPKDLWTVERDAFDHIVRPDLMPSNPPGKTPGVWPYVDPVPPKWE